MKKLLCGLAALPFLASVALAGQPVALTDNQMDTVTAGFDFAEVDLSDTSATMILINQPALPKCTSCYLQITGTSWGAGTLAGQSFQLISQFGP